MFGTVETRVRPLRLACLVGQDAPDQVRKAMQLCSSLWGGRFNPIIPLFTVVPDTWNDLHQAKPTPEAAVQGLLDAFDPDVLIRFVGQVPTHVANRGIEIVSSDEVWHYLGEGVRYPTTGVGVFELLDDVFQEWFKFETKYRPKMVLPSVGDDTLFWTSMCGDYSDEIKAVVTRDYAEPLSFESIECTGANFSRLMVQNTVLLTLRAFEERRVTSLRLTPAMSFKATGPRGEELEADLGFFWQESIYGHASDGVAFVECQTYGKFKQEDFDRMRTIARNFPGAILIFSTLRKSLEADEITAITEIAESGRVYWKSDTPRNPVAVLTGTELISDDGPPYCWDKARQEQFRNSPGILNLCDATQQIHLGLKSWRSAWHDNWERYKPEEEPGRP